MSTPDEIILITQPGPVVRVGGICYEFVEETTQPPTSGYDGVYEDCTTCQEASNTGSEQSTSSEGSDIPIPIPIVVPSSSAAEREHASDSSSSSSGDVVSPVLFLHMDGTDGSQLFIDSAKGKVIVPHGNVHIDTARRVSGTASGYFDGSLDYLTFGSSDEDFVFSGDFTISCWVMLGQALPATQSVFGISFTVLKLLIEASGQSIRLFTNGASTAGAVSMVVDNWYNLSVVRSGSTITVYMGGSPILTRTDGSVINASKVPMAIGTYGYTGGGQYFLGWIDEFSIIHKAVLP